MFWAVAVFGISGLAISFLGLLALAHMGVRGDLLIAPFICSLVAIFGIAGLLIWQLSRLVTLSQQQLGGANSARPAVKAPQPAQIAAPPEAAPSVVEHTTRQFAPAAYKHPGAHD